MSKDIYLIDGMTCASCALTVENAVKELPNVETAVVNLTTEKLTVTYPEGEVTAQMIEEVVANAGYKASVYQPNATNNLTDRQRQHVNRYWHQFILSSLFSIPLLYLAMGSMLGFWLPLALSPESEPIRFALLQLFLSLPVIYISRGYYLNGFKALLKGHPNMDSLVALATSFAFGYSLFATYHIILGHNHYIHQLYYESVVVILTLITLGHFFESKSKNQTSEAIQKLLSLKTNEVRKITSTGTSLIPIESVQIGDWVMVKPGEKIPVDGKVVNGTSYVDEAMLTGESIPKEKGINSLVYTGTINGQGNLSIEVTKTEEDSFLAQIIRLVEEAQGSKAPIAHIADKVSGIFVPIVMAIALLTALFWFFIMHESLTFSLTTAIAVLVIACPCALGLATPTAIMVGSGRAAQNGILFKGGEYLESLHHMDTVVFDKTGTITEGKPRVIDAHFVDPKDPDLLKEVIALEKLSEHPLAKAIVAKAEAEDVDEVEVKDFTSCTGRGIKGRVNHQWLLVGNQAFMEEEGISLPSSHLSEEKKGNQASTIVYIAKDKVFKGQLYIADQIKADSKETVITLKEKGVKTILLTGDNHETAAYIAQEAGIDKVYSQVFPDQKEKLVKALQREGKQVVMVGDGINDAPALASADIGIAIGSGTDIALESADIILMKSQVKDLLKAISLSQKTIKIVKENLFWAFIYNILMIPVAMGILHLFGGPLLNPMLAGLAMSLSSVSVVLNALRLKTLKL